MDFHTLSRKELQALCKKNKIPANMTNVAMADALNALPQVEGMDGNEQEFLSPVKPELFTPKPPRTSTRTSARRSRIAVEKAVDEMERRTVTRSTRRSVKKEEEEVKEITDGIAFIKISDTPSAVKGRKAPRAHQTAKKAVSEKVDVKSKEIGAYPADKMMTPATTARRSSARLRSKVTIGSLTPMAVKEETIEEKGSSGEIEKMKDLLFPDEIQEQKESQPTELKNNVEEENCELSGETVEAEIADAVVEKLAVEIEVNSDETVDLTVAIHSEITGEEEPICDAVVAKPAAEIELSSNEKVDLTDAVDSETPVNKEGETLVPTVVVETLDFMESSGEILVTPFCCDDEFEGEEEEEEKVLNVDENTGKMEFDELPTEVDDEESSEEISYETDAAVESEEPSRPGEEEITVEIELSSEEIPVIVGTMVSDEDTLDEISCENVAVVDLEELSDHDEEESTFVVESSAETPAIPTEPRAAIEIEGSLEEITCEDVAAKELDESPNHDEEEITVDMESSAETPAIPIEVTAVALSPIRAESITLTENVAAKELDESPNHDEEEITVDMESSAETPAIPIEVTAVALSPIRAESITLTENVAAKELDESPNHDEEEITVDMESSAETPAIPIEVTAVALSPIRAESITLTENVAAKELDESPNHDEEEITVDMESSAETPAIPIEVTAVALSPIRAESVTLTENPDAVDDVVTPNLSDTIFELSELFAKAVTSEPKTPTSAKPHLVVLQDRLPTSTKNSTVKRGKTVDENCDKENVGFNCNNNAILFAGDNRSARKQHQQKEDHDLKVMSLRQLKLEYKKVMSKKNLDSKNENMDEVKKRTALTPLKENCMRGVSN